MVSSRPRRSAPAGHEKSTQNETTAPGIYTNYCAVQSTPAWLSHIKSPGIPVNPEQKHIAPRVYRAVPDQLFTKGNTLKREYGKTKLGQNLHAVIFHQSIRYSQLCDLQTGPSSLPRKPKQAATGNGAAKFSPPEQNRLDSRSIRINRLHFPTRFKDHSNSRATRRKPPGWQIAAEQCLGAINGKT